MSYRIKTRKPRRAADGAPKRIHAFDTGRLRGSLALNMLEAWRSLKAQDFPAHIDLPAP